MEKKSNQKLGFIQEFHVLEIIIGDEKDDFNELKKIVSELWADNSIDNLEDSKKKTGTDLIVYDENWNKKILNLLNNSLDKSLNRTLKKEKREEDIFVKIIELEEKKGSLEIIVTIVTNLVNGFEKYNALRQSYDYFVQDINKIFAPIKNKKKVKIRLKNTSTPQKRRKDQSFFQLLISTNFFWSMSGALILYLEECYTDYNKYKNLGAAILFTGCFAFITSYSALSYIISKWFILLPVAFLWTLTIINIDMMIVNTMIKYEQQKLYKSLGGGICRIALSMAIAFALSIPVELTLFNDEIRDEIERYDRRNQKQEIDEALSTFDEIEDLKRLKTEKEKLFNDEMQGESNGSGKRGYGDIAKKIEFQVIELSDEIKILEQIKNDREASIRKELIENNEKNKKYGFLASYRALYRLQYLSEDESVFHITWGIRILLLLIELLPIVSKLLMPRGCYDSKYELEEYKLIRLNDKARKNIP